MNRLVPFEEPRSGEDAKARLRRVDRAIADSEAALRKRGGDNEPVGEFRAWRGRTTQFLGNLRSERKLLVAWMFDYAKRSSIRNEGLDRKHLRETFLDVVRVLRGLQVSGADIGVDGERLLKTAENGLPHGYKSERYMTVEEFRADISKRTADAPVPQVAGATIAIQAGESTFTADVQGLEVVSFEQEDGPQDARQTEEARLLATRVARAFGEHNFSARVRATGRR